MFTTFYFRFWGNQLSSVSDVFFSYFDGVSTCGGCKHNEFMKIPNHDLGGIKIYIAKRNPHEKLKGADEGTYVTYVTEKKLILLTF